MGGKKNVDKDDIKIQTWHRPILPNFHIWFYFLCIKSFVGITIFENLHFGRKASKSLWLVLIQSDSLKTNYNSKVYFSLIVALFYQPLC